MAKLDVSEKKDISAAGRRFRQYYLREGLKPTEAAQRLDLPNATLNRWIDGVNVTSEILLRIRMQFPSLNLRWLLTGQGTMTNQSPAKLPGIKGQMQQLGDRLNELADYNDSTSDTEKGQRAEEVMQLLRHQFYFNHRLQAHLSDVRAHMLSLVATSEIE